MLKDSFTAEQQQYCQAKGVREHPVLAQLRAKTKLLTNHQIQITPEQGAFMALLAQLTNAKNYLEIGTFTGYSTLWMALALPEDATITALDISDQHLNLARSHWHAAGVNAKITTMIAPATASLQQLVANYYDFAFIDANKAAYIDYYEYCLKLVRPGGLIIIDNVLMYGQVLEAEPKKKYIKVLQRLNDLIYSDPRVDICMLTIGDGMTLARKKPAPQTRLS